MKTLMLFILLDILIYFTSNKISLKTKYIGFLILAFLIIVFGIHPDNVFITSLFSAYLIVFFEIFAHLYVKLRASFTPYLAGKKILPIELFFNKTTGLILSIIIQSQILLR